MPEPAHVVFWEIGSPDPSRSAAFYERVCGWTFGPPDILGYRPASVGERGITGGILDTNGAPPFCMIYVQVDDLEASVAIALESGGTLAIPPTQVPELESRFAVVEDPDGNRVGFFSEPPTKQSPPS